MTTLRIANDTRLTTTSRKDDLHMFHIELRLADVGERQSLYRHHREGDRAAEGRTWSIRRRLGESIIRLGRRVGGDTIPTPAWQG